MENEQQTGAYQANDADALVGELFSGGISVEEAIERLRNRLLDLSARNRLLNYRYPKGRCIQIADKPSINLVFDRLYIDGKGVPFKYVPEPSPEDYEGKRPEARHWATRLGIDTSFDFPPNSSGSNGHRLHGIQTLLYPAELERQLRKLAGEAKTAVEETGTNMLFLIFGFLEFYDSEDSEKPMLAPLLSLPITLVRGDIDKETRTYQYTVQHNGEDLTENHTLREKLRRDFMLSIPEFGEEDEPEAYFSRIEQAVRTKRRWKVRRQITLGMLSFGKLAIWADLDTKKNQGLPAHELIRSVFSGGSSEGESTFYAEDYKIDERPEASQPLIYDADSSQHSAIIDVLSGKNLVINGPPGTGKSQTITNVIASAICKGKKVLFVSEKLAALEVVRHRLNHAGLGHFCLELHSHKTQKKKFLEDIQARIEEHFPAPSQFQAKLSILQRQKTELARYAELMGSRVGNSLGLTVNELFWAAERRRQDLGDLAAQVNAIGFPDASRWSHDEIESKRSRLSGLAEIYDSNGSYGRSHPWWGFHPSPLAPSDDEAIARLVFRALDHARDADDAANEAVAYFGFEYQTDPDMMARLYGWYQQSKARLVACPGLSDKVDLTEIDADRLAELASKAGKINADVETLSGATLVVRDIFGADIAGFHEAIDKGWDSAIGVLDKALENLGTVIGFFSDRAESKLSPREALRLMEAKADLTKVCDDLAALMQGEMAIRKAGGDELGSLSNLAVGRWDCTLREISEKASRAASVAEMAKSFGTPDTPLALALSFAKAKLALDSDWESIAFPPVWSRFQDWLGLANAAREDASAARGILESLSTIARNGVSVEQVLAADVEESEAKSILSRFSESTEVQQLLGELFSGVETDLEGLATTHAWGTRISALDLPSEVRRSLLSLEAEEALTTATRLFRRIDDGCSGARKSLEGLSSFGSFSWSDWQDSAQRFPGRDLPEEIMARLYVPADNPGSVLPWSKYLSLRVLAREEGLGDFVVALEEGKLPSQALAPAFELAAYQSIGRSVYQSFPELSRFNGSSHDQTREPFRIQRQRWCQ